MKLVFDTETTGLIKKSLPLDHPDQPRIVQLGAILYSDAGEVRAELNLIIKPDGWTIPKEAAAVHGITTEIAEQYGVPLAFALSLFNQLVKLADMVVAHNYDYDNPVVEGEFIRLGKPCPLTGKNNFCTMKAATDVVKEPGSRGYKWPRLQTTHKFLFGSEFEGAHDAMADVRACGRVFFELKKRNS
jgi:DNA polymerase-3 subunit epsilon